MTETTNMTLAEAIESLKKSLAKGDEMMKSETWSGGNFKSQAVRTVLDHLAAEHERGVAALGENIMMLRHPPGFKP